MWHCFLKMVNVHVGAAHAFAIARLAGLLYLGASVHLFQAMTHIDYPQARWP